MKKWFSLLLSLVLACCLTTGALADIVWCGWSGEEASTKPSVDKMIEGWNASNDVKVSWTGWPWADTLQQLLIRSSGSEPLDVAQVDSSMFPALIEAGLLEDLNTIIDPAWLSENFPESALNFGRKNGVQYGMPWTTASIGMTYNPTLLASVGYDAPPATIEAFEDCLAKLREKDKDLIPYALSTKDTTATADFMPWLWAFGGSVFDESGACVLDNQACIDTLAWYQKLAEAGYIKANMSRFDARQLYAMGKVGFYDDAIMARSICASNGVAEADLDKTILPMLRPVLKEGDAPTSTMWGHLLVVFKNSSDKASSADFVKYLVSKDVSLDYFAECNMLPVMNEALADEAVVSDAWASAWSEISATGRENELKFFANSNELSTIISEELQAVVIGEKTPEDAAKSMKTRVDNAM